MNNKKKKNVGAVIVGGIIAALIFIGLCGVSWIATCGLIKLITLCFGWTFKWSVATGIWLVMIILKNIFNISVKVKKEK